MTSSSIIKTILEPVAINSIVGASVALAARGIVNYAGRSIANINFGVNSLILTAALGAIQVTAPYVLSYTLTKATWRSHRECFIISSATVAAGLIGMTALAVKANLIVAGLSVSGALSLGIFCYLAAQGIDHYFDD